MRRAGIVVDVQAIRLVVDYIGICAQCVKDRLCNIPRATVSAVQTNLDTLERIDAQRDQVAHIAVATCHIVHSAANMLTMRKGQFRPVFVEYMELAVNVVLHEQQSLFRHLFTVAVDQLDAVVVVGVVAGRDHDAAVEVIHTGDVGYGRGCGDMEQISICTGRRQTSHQTIFKHIRATACILADNDTGRLIISVALTESIIVPAEETTYFVGVIGC